MWIRRGGGWHSKGEGYHNVLQEKNKKALCNWKDAAWQEAKLSKDSDGNFVFKLPYFFSSHLKKKKKKNFKSEPEKFATKNKWTHLDCCRISQLLMRAFWMHIFIYCLWLRIQKKSRSPYYTCHMSHDMCHMSCITCHMSHVICHMLRVTQDVSHVTCQMSHVTCDMWHITYDMAHVTCHIALSFSCFEQL